MMIAKLIFCITIISAGQVLLRHGMTGLSDITHAAEKLSVWAALFLYGTGMLIWLDVLRKTPLHLAYPCMALSFIIVPFTSYVFLPEKPTVYTYLGGVIIVIGIIVSYIPVTRN